MFLGVTEADPAILVRGLAQASATGVLVWVGALALVVVAGGFALVWVRRRSVGPGAGEPGAPFELHQLRAMRAAGRISEEEFASLRRAALREAGVDLASGSAPDRAAEPPPPGEGPPGDPGASGKHPA